MAITTKAEDVRVPEQSVESSASAVEWAAIVGGALAAVGINYSVHPRIGPWSFHGVSVGLV